MGVRLHLGTGKVVDLEDVPLEVFATIAHDLGTTWVMVADAPLTGDGLAAQRLVNAVASREGVEPPTLTVRNLRDVFEAYDGDTRPESYADGVPEVAGGPATT